MNAKNYTLLTGRVPIDFQLASYQETREDRNDRGSEVSFLYRSIIETSSQKKKQKQKPESKPEINQEESYYCEECKIKVLTTIKVLHLTSLPHQIASRPKITGESPISYSVNATNKGYQLLTNEGWCLGKGLGTTEEGRRLPIGTVFKKDKIGIGNKNATKKRITHTIDEIKNAPITKSIQTRDVILNHERDEKKRLAILNYLNRK